MNVDENYMSTRKVNNFGTVEFYKLNPGAELRVGAGFGKNNQWVMKRAREKTHSQLL